VTPLALGFLIGILTVTPAAIWVGYLYGVHVTRPGREPLPPLDDSYRRAGSQIRSFR